MPVIKSKEYKDINRLGKKVAYIFTQKYEGNQQAVEATKKRIDPFLFTLRNGGDNIKTDDITGIADDMKKQANQISKRKDGTYYGENYINFSGKDFDLSNHNPEYVNQVRFTMADITRKWIELRGIKDTTYVARPHFDTDNAHVHVLFTKNERDKKKRVHLTKSEFLKAQNDLNEYQRERHPHLHHTFEKNIKPQKRQRKQQVDKRILMKKHDRPLTMKRNLQTSLQQIMPQAQNLKSIAVSMKGKGFTVYERGGIPYGVTDGKRNYRFSTLLKGTENEARINAYFSEARQLAKARKRLDKSMRKPKGRQRGLDRSLERDL